MNSRRILSTMRTLGRVSDLSAQWSGRSFVLLSAVMLMMTLSSCSRKSSDSDTPAVPTEMSYLTISAALDVPDDTADSHLRATGEGTWKPIDGSDTNKPIGHHDGVGIWEQYAVNTFRVLLFDNNNYGKRYIPEGWGDDKVFETTLKNSNNHLAEVTASGQNVSEHSKTYTFPPIEVPIGSYHIVLVANASPTTVEHLKSVNTLADLERFQINLTEYFSNNDNGNGIINRAKLSDMIRNDKVGFPMIGELPIAVAKSGGTEANPVYVGNIDIKRSVSYLRMVITNVGKDGNIFPGADGWYIEYMGVVNGGVNSLILERPEHPIPIADLKFWHKTSGPQNEFIDYISWGNHGPGKIGGFHGGVPAQFEYEVYTTEKIGAVNSDDYLYYKIVMKKGNDTKIYMVPFYGGTDAHRDYNIYRNTLYNVTAYFSGGDIKTSVNAVPWSPGGTTNKEVTSDAYSNE